MKSLLFASACLAAVQGRAFRSQEKLKASSDFQGEDHFEHKYKGDIFHYGSGNPPTGYTTLRHIETDLKQLFSAKLPGLFAELKENSETRSDTGLLFCGAEAAKNAAGVSSLAFFQANTVFVNHDYSDSAVNLDGILGPVGEVDSAGQCGDNKCLPQSLVAKLAGLIRAHGYHVKHSDICVAAGQKNVFLDKCNIQGTFALRSYSCPRDKPAQYEQDEICGTNTQSDCINNAPNCQWLDGDGISGPMEYGCIADYHQLELQGCVENKDNSIGYAQPEPGLCRECHSTVDKDPNTGAALQDCPTDPNVCCPNNGFLWERKLSGQHWSLKQRPGGPIEGLPEDRNICMKLFTGARKGTLQSGDVAPNQVIRTIKYAFSNGAGANIPDSVAITGSEDGCAYLRGTVLAINGNKLHLKFIEKQHEAAEEYWQTQIDDTKAIIKTVREKIHNLQGLGGYFYPLENSAPFQCDSDFSAYEANIDAGGPEDPKCDLAGTDYASFQGTPHHKSMAQRSTCFCRSFAESGDDFYLSTTLANKAYCDANFKEKHPSVYTFCLQHADLGEIDEWKASLDELLFSANDVPTKLDTWFIGASDEIKKKFEDSIAGQGRTCGRVTSADPASVKFSNKGGNCVPINGVQDIVYRLEFEFFNADAAVDRKGTGNTYENTMCEPNPEGDQILSFRQLAYVWQRKNPNNPGKLFTEDDVNNDNIQTKDSKSQFYDDDGQDNYEDFCSVDYTQLLGGGKAYAEGGTKVADPLDFLVRVSGEASFMVEKTMSEKADVENQEQTLWSKMHQQLTEDKIATTLAIAGSFMQQDTYNNILNSIGEKVTKHFMAVLGHDATATGFSPICSDKVELPSITSDNGISKCDQVKELHVKNTGDITVGTFAAYAAPNLRKTVLESGTGKYDIKSMAFRDNAKYDAVNNRGSTHTILFKSDKYTPTGTGITVTMASNAIDAGARCGLLCDEGYFDNATEYFSERAGVESFIGVRAPICDPDNLAELGNRHCELDRRSYQVAAPREEKYKVVNDKFDGEMKFGFYSAQITRPTKFDCSRSPRQFFTRERDSIANFANGQEKSLNVLFDTSNSYLEPTLALAEFYLGTDCAELEIGDLSGCPFLEHIYIHTQTDYVTTGPNAAAAASCASKVDFSNAKFGDKLRFVWSDDAAVTTAARTQATLTDTSFIFFGEGSNIVDAAGTNVATNGEYCAKKSGTTPSKRGDQIYLVAGDSVKTRFSESCPWADKLVLPDSVPRLADSAILDLETDESIVSNETDAEDPGFFIGNPPFEIFVGEKLLDDKTATGARVADVDSFALFIDDDRTARLRRRCPTMTMDRDAGTQRVMHIPRSMYAIGAEEGDQPYSFGTPDIVRQPYMTNTYGYVNYGVQIPETTELMQVRHRTVRLDRAYDGLTSSRGHRSCFSVTQKQQHLANGKPKTCEELSDFYDCPAPFNWYCDSTANGGDIVNGPWPRFMDNECHDDDKLYPNWGLVLKGDFVAMCSDGKPYVFTSSAANLAIHNSCRSGGACSVTINKRVQSPYGNFFVSNVNAWTDYRTRPNNTDWDEYVAELGWKDGGYPYGSHWGHTSNMPTNPPWNPPYPSKGSCDMDTSTAGQAWGPHFENGQYRWGPEADYATQGECWNGKYKPTVSADMDFAKRCYANCYNMQGTMGGGGGYFKAPPTCSNTYPFPPGQAGCFVGNSNLAHGTSQTFYQHAAASTAANCAISEVRTCNNGVLSGSYEELSCTVVGGGGGGGGGPPPPPPPPRL